MRLTLHEQAKDLPFPSERSKLPHLLVNPSRCGGAWRADYDQGLGRFERTFDFKGEA
jgi:hypothetical protein